MNKMENIVSYDYTEFVIVYDFAESSGENTERFDTFEKAVGRMKELQQKGCWINQFYKIEKTVYKICEINKM